MRKIWEELAVLCGSIGRYVRIVGMRIIRGSLFAAMMRELVPDEMKEWVPDVFCSVRGSQMLKSLKSLVCTYHLG